MADVLGKDYVMTEDDEHNLLKSVKMYQINLKIINNYLR